MKSGIKIYSKLNWCDRKNCKNCYIEDY